MLMVMIIQLEGDSNELPGRTGRLLDEVCLPHRTSLIISCVIYKVPQGVTKFNVTRWRPLR